MLLQDPTPLPLPSPEAADVLMLCDSSGPGFYIFPHIIYIHK